MTIARVVTTLACLAVLGARPAHGQEPRLAGRIPEPTRGQVEAILSGAASRKLPVEPLIDRALEGAAKGAPPSLILRAVTRLRDELAVVRQSFGEAATTAELTAGASALRAGASADALTRLRRLRPNRPLTIAAAVMADLVAAGVSADTAVGAVLALAQDADDADYVAFRRNVQRDIALGASPSAALAVRIGTATDAASAPGTPQTGSTPPRKRKP